MSRCSLAERQIPQPSHPQMRSRSVVIYSKPSQRFKNRKTWAKNSKGPSSWRCEDRKLHWFKLSFVFFFVFFLASIWLFTFSKLFVPQLPAQIPSFQMFSFSVVVAALSWWVEVSGSSPGLWQSSCEVNSNFSPQSWGNWQQQIPK